VFIARTLFTGQMVKAQKENIAQKKVVEKLMSESEITIS